ncbi:hypothetical protein PS3A_38140 [Pseudomonas sp. 3A(2025)]
MTTPYDLIQSATRQHQHQHQCGAYTFDDGPGLVALVQQERPLRVLELGTALGFTACCLASATEQTRVDTLERDPEHVALAREQVQNVGLGERVTVHQGDFLETLAHLNEPYDLAFFDGFAPDTQLLAELRRLLRDKGILVCANLGLARDGQRQALLAELGDGARWEVVSSLEDGGTQVFRRV